MIPAEWGCRCGSKASIVDDTGHDSGGYVVRLRRCTACGACWATEEVPIRLSAYWMRRDSGNVAYRRAWWRRTRRLCCGHVYHGTNIGRHQRTAKHLARHERMEA